MLHFLKNKKKSKQPISDTQQSIDNSQEDMSQASASQAGESSSRLPFNEKEYIRQARIYEDQGNYELAIEHYTKIIKCNPKAKIAYVNRSVDFMKLKMFEQAIADCNEAFKIDSSYFFAFANRGYANLMLGKFDEAVQDSIKAIELNSKDPNPWYIRGAAYLDKKEFSAALADLTQSIKLYSSFPLCYSKRADACVQLGKHESAIDDYTNAIALTKSKDLKESLLDDRSIEDKLISLYAKRAEVYKTTKQFGLAFQDELHIHQLQKQQIHSLKDICKFFILHHHGNIIAKGGVRHFIEGTPVEYPDGESITDKLRAVLNENNITPDTIDLTRQKQGFATGTPTIFDEIRKEEAFYVQVQASVQDGETTKTAEVKPKAI